MAIEILLEGKLEKVDEKEQFTAFLKELCEKQKLKIEDYDTLVTIEVCPGGVIECSYEGLFVSLATTSEVVGPGYHAFVCRFFDDVIAESGIAFEVSDPTKYYEKRNFETLKYQYFYEWLKNIADYIKKHVNEDLSICWPEHEYKPMIKKEMVITPMGYIHKHVFSSYEIEELAQRFFIWNDLERNAAYYRNCAIALLWKDCFFEYSSMNEKTDKSANMILDYIEAAYDKDDTIALPFDQYDLLCDTIQREKAHFHHPEPLLMEYGYRKEVILYPFKNWYLPISGFSEVSYDATKETMHFMAPYKAYDEPWRWMVSAYADSCDKSLEEAYVDAKEDSFRIEAEDEIAGFAKIYMVDGYYHMISILQKDDQRLHVECILRYEEDIEMMKTWLTKLMYRVDEKEDLKN